MADLAEIQDTFDNHIFKLACQDVENIVSILSIESKDFHRQPLSLRAKVYEKSLFFGRFFYLVFVKGFTPTIIEVVPYKCWQILTVSIYIYRRLLLPFYLKLIGYGKYTSWTNPKMGSAQPLPSDTISKPYKLQSSLISEDRLAKKDFGDNQFENLVTVLYNKQAHLFPHSQSPGHPFVYGFPGNFMDHLLGVYKILVAWGQPQYIARAGLFHSLYGTFDYRASVYDLRKGRDELRGLIGPASEEIAFLICTSDRINLMRDLLTAMYGKNAKSALGGGIKKEGDGNPYPPRLDVTLSADGFPVMNHITQVTHLMPPHLFASFCIVMIADFMEQGALGLGSEDQDICFFTFLRYRFYSDLVLFIKPYLYVQPTVWCKYLCNNDFKEPLRVEVLFMKKMWFSWVNPLVKGQSPALTVTTTDKELLVHMVKKYDYLIEPRVTLAALIQPEEVVQGCFFLCRILVHY